MTVTREVTSDQAGLKLLHDTQVSLEKLRISVGNRASALEREADWSTSDVGRVYGELHRSLDDWEARIEELMARETARFPVWGAWLSHVKGIGPGLGSQLLAMLLPPLPDRGPSTWYKAAGLTVERVTRTGGLTDPDDPDGMSRLPRARAGRDGLPYYPRLRRCLHNVAESFVRSGGYYRRVYELRKARLVAQHTGHPDWPPYRIDTVARWVMVKMFLSHLWEVWLEVEGETGRRAYVLDVLGHPSYEPAPRWDGNGKI